MKANFRLYSFAFLSCVIFHTVDDSKKKSVLALFALKNILDNCSCVFIWWKVIFFLLCCSTVVVVCLVSSFNFLFTAARFCFFFVIDELKLKMRSLISILEFWFSFNFQLSVFHLLNFRSILSLYFQCCLFSQLARLFRQNNSIKKRDWNLK